MRGKLRQKKLYTGKISLYIDYYPHVWNPVKKIYTRREFLKLYLDPNPTTVLEKKKNELNMEIAEKIFLKRMKSFMLEENRIFNKDILNSDFYMYANNYERKRESGDGYSALQKRHQVPEEICRGTF